MVADMESWESRESSVVSYIEANWFLDNASVLVSLLTTRVGVRTTRLTARYQLCPMGEQIADGLILVQGHGITSTLFMTSHCMYTRSLVFVYPSRFVVSFMFVPLLKVKDDFVARSSTVNFLDLCLEVRQKLLDSRKCVFFIYKEIWFLQERLPAFAELSNHARRTGLDTPNSFVIMHPSLVLHQSVSKGKQEIELDSI